MLQHECCDLCNPTYLDSVRPGPAPSISRKKQISKGAPLEWVEHQLISWRCAMKTKYYPKAVWSPYAILDNETIELLASVGPIKTKTLLATLLNDSWARWDLLGDELFNFLHNLDIPPLQKKPRKRTQSLAAPTQSSSIAATAAVTAAPPAKRARTAVSSMLAPPIPPPMSSPYPPTLNHSISSTPVPQFHTPISSSLPSALSSASVLAPLPDHPIVRSNAPSRPITPWYRSLPFHNIPNIETPSPSLRAHSRYPPLPNAGRPQLFRQPPGTSSSSALTPSITSQPHSRASNMMLLQSIATPFPRQNHSTDHDTSYNNHPHH